MCVVICLPCAHHAIVHVVLMIIFVERKLHVYTQCCLSLFLMLIFIYYRQRYIAGIYLMGSGSTIKSGTRYSFVDSACRFLGPKRIYPFAFRTHAHHLGMLRAKVDYVATCSFDKSLPELHVTWQKAFWILILPGVLYFVWPEITSSYSSRCLPNVHVGTAFSSKKCQSFYKAYLQLYKEI